MNTQPGRFGGILRHRRRSQSFLSKPMSADVYGDSLDTASVNEETWYMAEQELATAQQPLCEVCVCVGGSLSVLPPGANLWNCV